MSDACEFLFSDVYRKEETVAQVDELCREYIGRENKEMQVYAYMNAQKDT